MFYRQLNLNFITSMIDYHLCYEILHLKVVSVVVDLQTNSSGSKHQAKLIDIFSPRMFKQFKENWLNPRLKCGKTQRT